MLWDCWVNGSCCTKYRILLTSETAKPSIRCSFQPFHFIRFHSNSKTWNRFIGHFKSIIMLYYVFEELYVQVLLLCYCSDLCCLQIRRESLFPQLQSNHTDPSNGNGQLVVSDTCANGWLSFYYWWHVTQRSSVEYKTNICLCPLVSISISLNIIGRSLRESRNILSKYLPFIRRHLFVFDACQMATTDELKALIIVCLRVWCFSSKSIGNRDSADGGKGKGRGRRWPIDDQHQHNTIK